MQTSAESGLALASLPERAALASLLWPAGPGSEIGCRLGYASCVGTGTRSKESCASLLGSPCAKDTDGQRRLAPDAPMQATHLAPRARSVVAKPSWNGEFAESRVSSRDSDLLSRIDLRLPLTRLERVQTSTGLASVGASGASRRCPSVRFANVEPSKEAHDSIEGIPVPTREASPARQAQLMAGLAGPNKDVGERVAVATREGFRIAWFATASAQSHRARSYPPRRAHSTIGSAGHNKIVKTPGHNYEGITR
jgi:hypothetical protein